MEVKYKSNTITPGTAGTTVLDNAIIVFSAISRCETLDLFGLLLPGVTIFGFKRIPSKKMLLSCKALMTAAKTLVETAKHLSIECVPSFKISGSTIGTKPLSWQMAAYLANPHAFSWIA